MTKIYHLLPLVSQVKFELLVIFIFHLVLS